MDAKQEIKLTIFRLIYEKGWDKTTYQAIANESGYEKTLVQYHFPQKNLFMILYIDFLVSAVMDHLADIKMSFSRPEVEFIVSSKIYTHLLLHKDIIENVTSKIVSERSMLTKIQDVHEQTAMKILDVEEDKVDEFLMLLRFGQGGHFDIIYRMIHEDMSCNIHELLALTLTTISPALKITPTDVVKVMGESLKYEDRVHGAVEKIVTSLKSRLGIVSFSDKKAK